VLVIARKGFSLTLKGKVHILYESCLICQQGSNSKVFILRPLLVGLRAHHKTNQHVPWSLVDLNKSVLIFLRIESVDRGNFGLLAACSMHVVHRS